MADRFPFLAMDLGLASIAVEPSFFDRWSTGENVLFTGEDYLEPGASAALEAAGMLPGMEQSIAFFRAVCSGPAESVPTLAEFHAAVDMAPGTGTTASSTTAGIPDRDEIAIRIAGKTRGLYQGQYPVLDPTRYQGLASFVGSKVELVGHVVSVKESYTKYGKPYAFVNFGDWRSSGTKLIYWSEGLEAAGSRAPDDDWEGGWISAVGLVDEPYANKRFGTVQYSITITITDSSQVRRIDRQEAERRLGVASTTGGGVSHTSSASTASSRPAHVTAASRTSNAELLQKLKQAPAQVNVSGYPARGSAANPTSKPPAPPVSRDEKSGFPRAIIVMLAVGALFLYFLSSY
jgi:hypothetical protein